MQLNNFDIFGLIRRVDKLNQGMDFSLRILNNR